MQRMPPGPLSLYQLGDSADVDADGSQHERSYEGQRLAKRKVEQVHELY